MPNVKFDITITGKFKLDGRQVRRVVKGVTWTVIGAGGLWLATHLQGVPVEDTAPLGTSMCSVAMSGQCPLGR